MKTNRNYLSAAILAALVFVNPSFGQEQEEPETFLPDLDAPLIPM